jgi:hypothetical protein
LDLKKLGIVMKTATVSINSESFIVSVDISIIESCKFTNIQIFVVRYLSTVVLIRYSIILSIIFTFIYFSDSSFCEELCNNSSLDALDKDALRAENEALKEEISELEHQLVGLHRIEVAAKVAVIALYIVVLCVISTHS